MDFKIKHTKDISVLYTNIITKLCNVLAIESQELLGLKLRTH